MTDTATITPKALAEKLGTDPKTVRRMLRKIAVETPGKGGRWVIPVEMLDELITKFDETRSGRSVTIELKDDAENDADAADDDETPDDEADDA